MLFEVVTIDLHYISDRQERFDLKISKFWILVWIESSKEQHLFEIENFCNLTHLLTITFDQFNMALLKVLISSRNFLTVVYI